MSIKELINDIFFNKSNDIKIKNHPYFSIEQSNEVFLVTCEDCISKRECNNTKEITVYVGMKSDRRPTIYYSKTGKIIGRL